MGGKLCRCRDGAFDHAREHRQQRADGLLSRLEIVPHDEASQVGYAQRADVRVEHGREKVHVRRRVRKVGREDQLNLEHAPVPERLCRTCKVEGRKMSDAGTR